MADTIVAKAARGYCSIAACAKVFRRAYGLDRSEFQTASMFSTPSKTP